MPKVVNEKANAILEIVSCIALEPFQEDEIGVACRWFSLLRTSAPSAEFLRSFPHAIVPRVSMTSAINLSVENSSRLFDSESLYQPLLDTATYLS